MPRPDSMKPTAPTPRVPCTKKREFAHHTVFGDPADGKVVGHCRYCRRKFVKPAGIKVWETWAGTVVIPSDTALRRTYVGASSDYL